MTVREVAKALDTHPKTVKRYINERRRSYPRLQGKKRGGRWFVACDEFQRFQAEWFGEAVA